MTAVGLLVACAVLATGCVGSQGDGSDRTAIRPSELPEALAGGVHVLMAGTCGGSDEVKQVLALEDYVPLCVACEASVATRRNAAGALEFTWSDEALRFQGVLCRSYAAYHIQTGEKRRAMASRGLGSCAHLTGGEASQVVGEIEGDRVICQRHVTRLDNARTPRSPGTVGGMLQPLAAILAPTAGLIAVRGDGMAYPTEYYSGAVGSWTNPRIDHTRLPLWFPKQGSSADFETVLREQYRKSDLTLARVGSDDAPGGSTGDSPRFAVAQPTDVAFQPGEVTEIGTSSGGPTSALVAAQAAWEAAREAARDVGVSVVNQGTEVLGTARDVASVKWEQAKAIAARSGLTVEEYLAKLKTQWANVQLATTGYEPSIGETANTPCVNPRCSGEIGTLVVGANGSDRSCFSPCSVQLASSAGYTASYGRYPVTGYSGYAADYYASGTYGTLTAAEQNALLLNLARTDSLTTTPTTGAARCAPTTETCNGVDDDCDGQIDEAADVRQFEGLPCPVEAGQGACHAGTTVCAGGELHCQARPASPELCDGFDNDCNGTIDDVAGGCATTTTCTPKGEQCNGQDDDCDGFPDNGNPGGGSPCTLDAGGQGTVMCAEGQLRCVALVLAPTPALAGGANPLAGVAGADQAGAVLGCGLVAGAPRPPFGLVLIFAALAVARLRRGRFTRAATRSGDSSRQSG